MRIFLDIDYGENQNSHFTFNNFSPENLALYETRWKNMVKSDWPLTTIPGYS